MELPLALEARQDPYGSACFAHRFEPGQVCHMEIGRPDFKGFVRAGYKTLFALTTRA